MRLATSEQLNIQPSRQAQFKFPHYFLGLGLGLIPLAPVLIALGMSVTTWAYLVLLYGGALLLYVIEIIAAIITLNITRVRSVGRGLLTMVLISPVVFVIEFVLTWIVHPPSFEFTLTLLGAFLGETG